MRRRILPAPPAERPYSEDGLAHLTPPEGSSATTPALAAIPTTRVPLAALTPTQPDVSLERLAEYVAGARHRSDPYPHVVHHDGRLYVQNGHHRWLAAHLRGDDHLVVRITDPAGEPAAAEAIRSGAALWTVDELREALIAGRRAVAAAGEGRPAGAAPASAPAGRR